MNETFLHYDGLTLLNLPHAQKLYEEVLVQDCYQRKLIPHNSIVLDVGGCFGEFGIWCEYHRACHVKIFEPSPVWKIAQLNSFLNMSRVWVVWGAIGRENGPREFHHRPDAPYGSRLSTIGQDNPCVQKEEHKVTTVDCFTLKSQIDAAKNEVGFPRPICVKLDCEGAEQEVFEDERWLDEVAIVAMEWHFKDGPRYRDALTRHGFKVTTTDANPEAWSGNIYATKL
ncbi:MAG: FkbM family methyltransferase [Planctomycetota bacterium]